jgi:hypothetical protein
MHTLQNSEMPNRNEDLESGLPIAIGPQGKMFPDNFMCSANKPQQVYSLGCEGTGRDLMAGYL